LRSFSFLTLREINSWARQSFHSSKSLGRNQLQGL
jgi:hypothetical protein